MRVMNAIGEYPLPPLNLADRGIFTANLLFIYGLIVASEPLIEGVLKRDMPDALRLFYADHLEEERGHAASLATDLAFLAATPALDWHAAQIAGTQYYLTHHAPPEALLGYMAALECRPMPLAVIDELERLHGVPAMRTMHLHAGSDPEHAADLLGVIESLGEPDIIVSNARLTASMLKTSLERLGRGTCQ